MNITFLVSSSYSNTPTFYSDSIMTCWLSMNSSEEYQIHKMDSLITEDMQIARYDLKVGKQW